MAYPQLSVYMDITDQGFLKSKKTNLRQKHIVKLSELKRWLKPYIREIIKSQSKK